MFPNDQYPTEDDLVQGCLACRIDAWKILYHHHHEPLARFVLRLLGSGKRRMGLAEEIAHDTLSSLWENDCHRLRVYDSGRCCLRAYLGALALQRVQLLYRQTHRRGYQQVPLGTHEPPDTGVSIEFVEAVLRELDGRLTRQERRYFRQELLGESLSGEPCSFSPVNAEKLRQRIRLKLLAVLEESAGLVEAKKSAPRLPNRLSRL